MKAKQLTVLAIVAMAIGMSSCQKSIKPDTRSEETSQLTHDSKAYFGESNSTFDNRVPRNLQPVNLDELKKENSYFVFADYAAFFKTLETLNTLSPKEYEAFAAAKQFTSRNTALLNLHLVASDNLPGYVPTPAFSSYFRLLDQQGAVKIGNEIHVYTEHGLSIIRDGDPGKIIKSMTLVRTDEAEQITVAKRVATISNPIDYNIVAANNDANHLASIVSQGFAVQVTSPVPGTDAYNYDFHVQGNSLIVNIPNFPCDQAFSYFRCILQYTDYLGNPQSINSVPWTQGDLYNTATTAPTVFNIAGNVGQAIIPAGGTFAGNYCSQVGFWERYPAFGIYAGTGGVYKLKASLNSCKPFSN